MALQKILATFSIQDADGDRATVPVYGLFDDTSATLTSIAAWVAARAAQLDAMIEGQIVSMGYTIFPALPGGLKGAPVAGSDVERTGLLTWNLNVSPVRAYGQDIPSLKDAAYTGDLINQAQADVAAWITAFSPPPGTVNPTGEDFAYTFVNVRKGVKSFRKLGKRP